jgi:glucosamine-6-phosphate deaminase
MDEYLSDEETWIPEDSPLSFRGFIRRELTGALPAETGFCSANVHFPDPRDPAAYDQALADKGGADMCLAGVGITGHLAFNEPPEPGQTVSVADFADLPSRVVRLARESIAINSNTAMRGAMNEVPPLAVTVGMRQILGARKLRICCNRPWQSAVVRRFLFGEMSSEFPVTLARSHPDVRLVMTAPVAEKPEFALR